MTDQNGKTFVTSPDMVKRKLTDAVKPKELLVGNLYHGQRVTVTANVEGASGKVTKADYDATVRIGRGKKVVFNFDDGDSQPYSEDWCVCIKECVN